MILSEISESCSRVLVIRAGQLGDTICASSIIEPLRNMFNGAVQIDWVAKKGVGRIFCADPRINQLFELKSRKSPLFLNPGKLRVLRESYLRPYDLVVNMELGPVFNGMIRLVRAKQKIGLPYRLFAEPKETHAVENLHIIFRSFLPEDCMALAEPSLVGSSSEIINEKYGLSGGYIVLVPSNSHHGAPQRNYRAWPVNYWRELMRLLIQQKQKVVIVGGRNEEEYFKRFQPIPVDIVDLVGKTDFPDLIGVLQNACMVVSTDTGPAHMAGAVGVPVLTLIGPTNPKRTAPYATSRNSVHVLTSKLECSPCYHSQQYQLCEANRCMTTILPEAVMAEIERLLTLAHKKS